VPEGFRRIDADGPGDESGEFRRVGIARVVVFGVDESGIAADGDGVPAVVGSSLNRFRKLWCGRPSSVPSSLPCFCNVRVLLGPFAGRVGVVVGEQAAFGSALATPPGTEASRRR
jgi:hypothetical protein